MTDPDKPKPSYEQLLVRLMRGPMESIRQKVLNPRGGSPASIQWNQARATSILAQIEKEMNQARRQLAEWTGQATADSAAAGWRAGQMQLADLGGGRPVQPRQFDLVNFDVVKTLAADVYGDLNKALTATETAAKSTLRQMSENGLTAEDVNEILAGSVIEGTPRSAQLALRDKLQAIHGESITFPSGHTMNVSDYARMLARTRLREAHVLARHDRLQRDGVDHVVIIGNRTIYPCTSFLGKIYYIGPGEDPAGYPSLSSIDGPPFHPNCSKTTAPIILELASETQRELGKPDFASQKVAELGADSHAGFRFFQDDQVQQQVAQREKKLQAAIRAQAKSAGYDPGAPAPLDTPRRPPSSPSPGTPGEGRGGGSATNPQLPTINSRSGEGRGGGRRLTPSERTDRLRLQAAQQQLKTQAATEKLRAQLAQTQARRQEAQAQLQRMIDSLAQLKQQLAAVESQTSLANQLRQRIAALQTIIDNYERAIRRAEKKE